MKVLNEKRQYKGFNYNIINLTVNQNPNEVLFVFPGAAYNFLGPLMYYPTHAILENGGTVITVDYDFRFIDDSYPISKEEILKSCMSECLQFALQHYPQVQRKVFLGKSIGTQAMCYLNEVSSTLNFSMKDAQLIWLTPVFMFPGCLAMMGKTQHNSLFIIGDKDPHYSPEAIEKIQSNNFAQMKVFEGADHSMDIANSWEKTIACHKQVTEEFVNFIKS